MGRGVKGKGREKGEGEGKGRDPPAVNPPVKKSWIRACFFSPFTSVPAH